MNKLKHFTINTLFYALCFVLAQPIVLIAFVFCAFEGQFYRRYFYGFWNDWQRLKDDNKRLAGRVVILEHSQKIRNVLEANPQMSRSAFDLLKKIEQKGIEG